jgi:SAM-dependent methyltransferase
MTRDRASEEYFERFTPHYYQAKFAFALDVLRRQGRPDQSLVDIGCGDGTTLDSVRSETPISRLAGLDFSRAYLDKAVARTGCEPILGSILDAEVVARHRGRFDFALLGEVLHHLIGSTRRESHTLARLGVAHALELLKPGGHLIVFEPTFTPRSAMWFAFWVKRLVGGLVASRLELGSHWINIAQPVVRYYSDRQVGEMVREGGGAVVESHTVARGRLAVVLSWHKLGLVARREPLDAPL